MKHIIWRNRASAILGILVMLMPFTGFPEPVRESLVVLFGFFIALFGFYHGGRSYSLKDEVATSVPGVSIINLKTEGISGALAKEKRHSRKKNIPENPLSENVSLADESHV